MEKGILKKALAIIMIIMILATDFFVLGSNLVSYAATLDSSTNNENIEFSAYFKDENEIRVNSINKSIKTTNLKMFAEIKVKNEGYFNGTIELQESNFKIKENILSTDIESIEGNKINLKQINAGSTVELEFDIEPIITEKITVDMLSKDTSIKLTGQYMETTYKGLEIEATKTIKANFEVDETANAELVTDIITNAILTVNGANKRVVQLLIKSRLLENQYPINNTKLEVELPSLSQKQPEDINVLALGTKATNGNEASIIEDFTNESGKLQITLKNEANEENKISWNKDAYDEIVVTLIYAEDADASKVEIKTNSEITLYNSSNKYTATYTKGIENQSLNKTIATQIQENTAEIYKGQLYENAKSENNIEISYKTETMLNITNPDLVDRISIKEGPDVFTTYDLTELTANTKFVSTEINKEKMLNILGQDGTIQINDGETIQNISKDTETNESGNIVINYTADVNEIEVITSKPVKSGVLEIIHNKVIAKNTYSIEQLKTIKQLTLRNTVIGTLGENKVVENSTEASLELKETQTKAELTINKESLSTMTTNSEVIFGVKLITNGTKYDLYKNPKITIQLPAAVEEVTVNGEASKLYADEFEMRAVYNNNTKAIEITLTGEQTSYPEGEASQAYLQFNLNLKLSKLAPSKTDKIIMTYTNENAKQYAGETTDAGVVEKEIEILSPSGLIPVNNIETYGIEGIGGITENKQVATVDKNTAGGTDVKYNISLVNNTKNDVNNVRILGILPTEGSFVSGTETITNTFATTLKSVTASNATIYYSNNMNATADLSDVNNGWKSSLIELSNPKSYLIVIANIPDEGVFNATYTVTLPADLEYDRVSYSGYQVLFNEGTETSTQKIQSTLSGITTGTGIKLESTLSATVGNETLNNGDTVKEGEVINYTVTVKNNGTQNLENVVVKSAVPEGTVYVVPKTASGDLKEDDIESGRDDDDLGAVYSGLSYYEEKVDVKEVTQTITSLIPGQEYTFNYEVRVNMDITEGTETSNKATVIYQQYMIESNEFKTRLSESKLRVTIKSTFDDKIGLEPGAGMEYLLFVENMTDQQINDLTFQIITEGVKVTYLKDGQLNLTPVENVNKINKISPNSIAYYYLPVSINKENISQISATLKVTDSEGNIYRANKIVREVEQFGATIELTTPNNGEYVNIGEEINYNITVKNTGNSQQALTIIDEIPEYLEVQQMFVDNELKKQTIDVNNYETYIYSISNNIEYFVTLEAGSEKQITIIAKVKQTDEKFETKTIVNSAKVQIMGIEMDSSEEVTHIIKGKIQDNLINIISGLAWLDENQNGKKEAEEKLLPGINVKLFDISTNNIAHDIDGNIAETTTNDNGEYSFTKIEDGEYIVLFEFDRSQYELTEYMKPGVQESQNSNVVLKSITINGQEKIYAVTDTINLKQSISNINIGLKEKLIYDLELDKYISRIVVQNTKGTKAYEYNDSVFQKIEINGKQLKNSIVVLEYTIRVKNAGEIAGNVNSIVDYLPSGLEFSSELNPEWYLSGENLHTKSLANDKIKPGETREVKLILTKKMTENNTGLINNRAEIEESFNDFGKTDIDSTVNNLMKNEDDLGAADVIISISTGARNIAYTLLIIINTGLIAFAIYLIFKRNKKII